MRLDLTDDQARTLVECLYIANWIVAGWNDFDDLQMRSDVSELEQLIFGVAADSNPDYLEGEPGAKGELFPTMELEERSRARDALDLYEDNVFWEELIERLAEREAMRDTGEAAWRTMSGSARIDRVDPHAKRIREALRRHGINALMVTTSDPNG